MFVPNRSREPSLAQSQEVGVTRRLGVIALVLAAIDLCVSSFGFFVVAYSRATATISVREDRQFEAFGTVELRSLLAFAVVFGLGSLILAVISIAKSRGRIFGILAVVISLSSPVICAFMWLLPFVFGGTVAGS
jgi:glucan phosphoethanolaminetransferase (alkaline phosphatase superfamily)